MCDAQSNLGNDDQTRDDGEPIDRSDDERLVDPDEALPEVEYLLPGPVSSPLIDRRDRIWHPRCEDELFDPRYQRTLNGAYWLVSQNRRLRMSLHQTVRTDYVIGKYCESQGLFALAADHYRHGAEVAQQIPDPALYAQLKHKESRSCASVDHDYQFRRLFECDRDAWNAWRQLPYRNLTADMIFEFKLADSVGLSAVRVAEYGIAVDAMERATVLLQGLRSRPDVKSEQYADFDLLLTWDWVTVRIGKGDYREAFKNILQTRRKGKDLLKPINRVRLQWLIAIISLNCAEQGAVQEYTHGRLLAVAEKAIDHGYSALKDCDDEEGRALILLAEAKLLGMLRISDARLDKIKEAEEIAKQRDNPVLRGHVAIAWADEQVLQGKKREAKALYSKVIEEMSQLEFLELANIARQRLDRLSRRKSGSPRRKPKKPNDPPSKGEEQLN